MKVVILESAEQDLQELRIYILKNFSIGTWQNTYSQIKDSIRNLANFPYLGKIPVEIESLNLIQYRQFLLSLEQAYPGLPV